MNHNVQDCIMFHAELSSIISLLISCNLAILQALHAYVRSVLDANI